MTCVVQNAGEEGSSPLRLLKRLAHFTYLTDVLRDHVTRAVIPADIEAAKKRGKYCLYLTGNGVPLSQEWNSVTDELAYIRLFFQLGIRMMHLTYNRRMYWVMAARKRRTAGSAISAAPRLRR